ncbi:MAG: hypothetical protein ACWA44_10700 [Thiotrichales bacterium]
MPAISDSFELRVRRTKVIVTALLYLIYMGCLGTLAFIALSKSSRDASEFLGAQETGNGFEQWIGNLSASEGLLLLTGISLLILTMVFIIITPILRHPLVLKKRGEKLVVLKKRYYFSLRAAKYEECERPLAPTEVKSNFFAIQFVPPLVSKSGQQVAKVPAQKKSIVNYTENLHQLREFLS